MIKFYGTRGSAPALGDRFHLFGGNTSCYVYTSGATRIMIDAGTGVSNALGFLENADELHLLITHTHHDHISGLVSLLPDFMGRKLHIYGRALQGLTIEQQISRLIGPPLWPVGPEIYGCVTFHTIEEETFQIGDVRVSAMAGNHPGGVTLYRLDGEDSVVIASDYNHDKDTDTTLIKFAENCDLLVYDGFIRQEDYATRSDWGHSTPQHGATIAEKCHAKMLAITHHGSGRTDEELLAEEALLANLFPCSFFAREFQTFCKGAVSQSPNKYQILVDIGRLLSSEKDRDKLLEHILHAAMSITGADGGTLYICEKDYLQFRYMITKSKNIYKGGANGPIDLPPVRLLPTNVCAAAVLEQRLINIPDVYNSQDYDFSGPKKYDQMTGYKTTSVMVVPMEDDSNTIIGVLQLINATDLNGNILPFSKDDEQIIASLASQAAICMTNMNYSLQITDLLSGFVRVMSTSIDERTPYNANHTRNMVKYGSRFFDYEKKTGGPYHVEPSHRDEILMSVWLHDIGKLITPLEIMNKSDRLAQHMFDVENRFGRIELLLHLRHAKKELSDDEFKDALDGLARDLALIQKVNTAGFLPEETFAQIQAIGLKTYRELDGTVTPYLTEIELDHLSIRKGTLTANERAIMEGHVTMTTKMLQALDFPKNFTHVPFWAGAHHELLNGQGYPQHLCAEDIPWEVRLITILDVFDALTARDRPYKLPMPVEKAIAILHSMVSDGQIDSAILEEFIQSNAWDET